MTRFSCRSGASKLMSSRPVREWCAAGVRRCSGSSGSPGSQVGHGLDGVAGELESDPFGCQECLVLADERGPRLTEDPGEVVAGEVVHLDADREPALKLGHEVRRFAAMEGARGDEEDVIGLDRAVLGVDGRPLDDWQKVALDPLARDVRARAPAPSSPAILSSSSMKTIPDSSARTTAAWLIFSGSMRVSISCWRRIGRASRTVIRRVCDCLGMIFSNMSWRSISICSMLPAPRIEIGATFRPGMVISTSRSSSSPDRRRFFIFSRERRRLFSASPVLASSPSLQVAGAGGGKRMSSRRCSTLAFACSSTASPSDRGPG